MEGRFITLEGGEGVGKSTNIAFVRSLLEQHKIPVHVTREPGGTVLAETIRTILLHKEQETLAMQTELLLMFAARAQHLQQVIKPTLAKGTWVLCDRFTDATYAYQGGGRHLDMASIRWLENFVQQGLRPDLTLLLDAPVDIGLARVGKRGNLDRFESEKQIFFQRVRDTYLEIAKQQPERVKLIDASKSLPQVQNQICQIMATFING